ncbi:MAG: InlB B-repeat-containing protein [Firmicutes bacterium]|nr:InlB B-repeat-containing protein [Bacillota bacterium]
MSTLAKKGNAWIKRFTVFGVAIALMCCGFAALGFNQQQYGKDGGVVYAASNQSGLDFENALEIGTAAPLLVGGAGRTMLATQNRYVRLTADINISGNAPWTPIPTLAAGTVFDGGIYEVDSQGDFVYDSTTNEPILLGKRKIVGLTNTSNTNNIGFVANLLGTFKNVDFENVNLAGTGTNRGVVAATVQNGNQAVNARIENVGVVNGAVGGTNAGGLVGSVGVSNSVAATTVLTIDQCYNMAAIAAVNDAGGLVGSSLRCTLTITKSFNSGSVVSASINNRPNVGGILGLGDATILKMENVYCTARVEWLSNGQGNVGGIIGNLQNAGATTLNNVAFAGTLGGGGSAMLGGITNNTSNGTGPFNITNCYYPQGQGTSNIGGSAAAQPSQMENVLDEIMAIIAGKLIFSVVTPTSLQQSQNGYTFTTSHRLSVLQNSVYTFTVSLLASHSQAAPAVSIKIGQGSTETWADLVDPVLGDPAFGSVSPNPLAHTSSTTSYTFTINDIYDNMEIFVGTSRNTYTVSAAPADAGAQGTFGFTSGYFGGTSGTPVVPSYPAGVTGASVNHGTTINFQITMATGYTQMAPFVRFGSTTISGTLVSAGVYNYSYVVNSSAAITITPVSNNYAVTRNPAGNYTGFTFSSISPETVGINGSYTFTLQVNEAYRNATSHARLSTIGGAGNINIARVGATGTLGTMLAISSNQVTGEYVYYIMNINSDTVINFPTLQISSYTIALPSGPEFTSVPMQFTNPPLNTIVRTSYNHGDMCQFSITVAPAYRGTAPIVMHGGTVLTPTSSNDISGVYGFNFPVTQQAAITVTTGSVNTFVVTRPNSGTGWNTSSSDPIHVEYDGEYNFIVNVDAGYRGVAGAWRAPSIMLTDGTGAQLIDSSGQPLNPGTNDVTLVLNTLHPSYSPANGVYTYRILDIQSNITIQVSASINTYAVNFPTSGTGFVSVVATTPVGFAGTVNHNGSFSFTVTSDLANGYGLFAPTVTVNGGGNITPVSGNTTTGVYTYTINNITAIQNISIAGNINTYAVNRDNSGDGWTASSGATGASWNGDYEFTVTVAPSHRGDSVNGWRAPTVTFTGTGSCDNGGTLGLLEFNPALSNQSTGVYVYKITGIKSAIDISISADINKYTVVFDEDPRDGEPGFEGSGWFTDDEDDLDFSHGGNYIFVINVDEGWYGDAGARRAPTVTFKGTANGVTNGSVSVFVSDPRHNPDGGVFVFRLASITTDIELSVTATINQYTVSRTADGTGFSSAPNAGSASPVDWNGSYEFTVNVGANYRGDIVNGWRAPSVTLASGTGSLVLDTGHLNYFPENGVYTYKLTGIKSNIQINISVQLNTYIVAFANGNALTGDGWAATPGTSPVSHGGNYTYTVTLDVSHRGDAINGWRAPTVSAGTLVPGSSDAAAGVYVYTITGVTTNVTIAISNVTRNQYTVAFANGNALTGDGWTATPGASPVAHGGNYTFTVTLDVSHRGDSVNGWRAPTVSAGTLVPGESDATIGVYVYTITGVTGNTTITVSNVTRNQYSVTLPSSRVGYSFAGITEPASVGHGQAFSFQILVSPSHHTPVVTIKGGSTVPGTFITDRFYFSVSNVQANFELEVLVTPYIYTVTLPSGQNAVGFTADKDTLASSVVLYHYQNSTTPDTKYYFAISLLASHSGISSVSVSAGTATLTPLGETSPGSGVFRYELSEFRGTVEGIVISATATIKTYNVSFNGGLSAAGWEVTSAVSPTTNSVDYGSEFRFFANVNTGYNTLVVEYTMAGGATQTASRVGSTNEYYISNITGNVVITISSTINSYNVSVAGGNLTPAGWTVSGGDIVSPTTNPVNYNLPFSFDAQLNTGYHTLSVTYTMGGVSMGALTAASGTDTFTIPHVTGNIVITVSSILHTYTITASAVGNGNISPSGTATINYGSNSSTYTFTPNTGYEVVGIIINKGLPSQVILDGTTNPTLAAAIASGYRFMGVTANFTIEVTFAIRTFTLTVTQTANGTIEFDSATAVTRSFDYGSTPKYDIVPATGYGIDKIIIGGTELSGIALTNAIAAGSYTFAAITAATSIEVTFKKIVFTIEASAGSNGSITPSGYVSVNHGENESFTFNPSTGYRVVGVEIDGTALTSTALEDVINANGYTFTNVTGDGHSIHVTFTIIQYTVTASAGGNGNISPSGAATINHGSNSAVYTFAPATGYYVESIVIDGTTIYTSADPEFAGFVASGYQFVGVTGQRTIHVTFAIYTYDITVTATGNGTVEPTAGTLSGGKLTVNYGATPTFTITPAANHHIVSITVGGAIVANANSYTFTAVTANTSIAVVFAIDAYTVSFVTTNAVHRPASSWVSYTIAPTTIDHGAVWTVPSLAGVRHVSTFANAIGFTVTSGPNTGATVYTPGQTITITGTTTITIVFDTGTSWSVTLDEGDSNIRTNFITGQLATDNLPDAPNYSKANHDFLGWSLTYISPSAAAALDATGLAALIAGGTSVNADNANGKTYYAVWRGTAQAVTFKDHDGTTLGTDSIYYNESIAALTPPAAGAWNWDDREYYYTFKGWSTSQQVYWTTGNVDNASWNEGVLSFPQTITGATNYYAVYTRAIKYYTVTWISDNNATTTQSTYRYDDVISIPGYTAPSNTATWTYTFVGWRITVQTDFDTDTGGTVALTGTKVTADATYYAIFSRAATLHTINWYNFDGTLIKSDSLANGLSLTLPTLGAGGFNAPSNTVALSYTFKGWSHTNTGHNGATIATPTVVEASLPGTGGQTINYYAIFNQFATPYVVTFVTTNAVELVSGNWEPYTVDTSNSATYSFYGGVWTVPDLTGIRHATTYADAIGFRITSGTGSGSTVYSFGDAINFAITIQSATTITIVFAAGTSWSITLDEGDSNIRTNFITGQLATGDLPAAPNYSKANHDFLGWSLTMYTPSQAAALSGQTLQDIEDTKTGSYSVTADSPTGLTYYAVWRGTAQTVTFNEWRGASATQITTQQIFYNESVSFGGTVPANWEDVEYKYTFIGWNTTQQVYWNAAVGGGRDNAAWNESVLAFPQTITAPRDYYAVYKREIKYYTLTWTNYDDAETVQSSYRHNATINIPSVSGPSNDATWTYTFAGWRTTGAQSDYSDQDNLISVSALTGTQVTADVTYYALFSRAATLHTINWYNFDGTLIKSDSLANGAGLTLPTLGAGGFNAPSNTVALSYSWKGWNTTNTNWGGATIANPTVVNVATPGTGSVTIDYYAIFNQFATPYTVTFDTTGAEKESVLGNGNWAPFTITQEIIGYGSTWTVIGLTGVRNEVGYANAIGFRVTSGPNTGATVYTPGQTITITGTTTITIAFASGTYFITLDEGDGNVRHNYITGQNAPGTLPSLPNYSKADHDFLGWSLTYISPSEAAKLDSSEEANLAATKGGAVTATGELVYRAVWRGTAQAVNFYDWRGVSVGSAIDTQAIFYNENILSFGGVAPSNWDDREYYYTFKGWSTSQQVYWTTGNVDNASWNEGVLSFPQTITGATNYYAVYTRTIKYYTITWKNYDDTTAATQTTYRYGDAITPPSAKAVPNDELFIYTFLGWRISTAQTDYDTDVSGFSTSLGTISGNATYYAGFSRVDTEHTVNWYNFDGTLIKSELLKIGAAITEPTAHGNYKVPSITVSSVYSLKGWNTSLTAHNGSVITLDANLTLTSNGAVVINYYAVFNETPRPYTVTFVTTNAVQYVTDAWVSYTITGETINFGSTWTVPSLAGIRHATTYANATGFRITSGTGSGATEYTPGQTITIQSATTITIVFAAGTSWSITLDEGDSNIVPDYITGQNATGSLPAAPTYDKTNYDFLGWSATYVSPSQAAAGLGTIIAGGTSVTADSASGKTYYAVWRGEEQEVNFYNWDGTSQTLVQTVKVYYGESAASIFTAGNPSITQTNFYTFAFEGWNTTKQVHGIRNGSWSEATVTPGTILAPTDYYAVYKRTMRTYSINWYDYDGTLVTAQNGLEYDAVISAPSPTKAPTSVSHNYAFAGWRVTSQSIGDDEYNFGDLAGVITNFAGINVTASNVYYALFSQSIKVYSITASAGSNGSIAPAGSVAVNHGASRTFTFSPAANHHVASITVDGTTYTSADGATFDGYVSGGYTFSNVTANGHTISVTFAIDQRTITVTTTGSGTVTTATGSTSGNVVTVNYGATPTFTITPAANHHIVSITVGGVALDGTTNPTLAAVILAGAYQFASVTANTSIAVVFAIDQRTITASAGANGNISPIGNVSVDYNGSQKFTFAADANYHIASLVVIINGVQVSGPSIAAAITAGEYTFTNVTTDCSISVTFAIDTYTISASAGSNGNISPAGSVSVDHGADQTFTFHPAANYHVASITVDGTTYTSGATFDGFVSGGYTFSNVTTTHTISVTFAINTNAITASTGSNGNISPSGIVNVNYGASSPAFTFTPNTGYEIDQVLVNGVNNAGAVSSGTYTFISVTSAQTISVTFKLKSYTITITTGSNGTTHLNDNASPVGGSVEADHFSTPKFTFVPATGYRVIAISVDTGSGSLTALTGTALTNAISGGYTFASITGSRAISVTFDKILYTITASTGSNGSISPAGSVSVRHGEDEAFTFTPNTGYEIDQVLVNGVNDAGAVPSGTYTFTNVTTTHTISVTFKLKTYTITASAGSNGSISPSGNVPVNHAASQAFMFVPDANYHVESITINGTTYTSADGAAFDGYVSLGYTFSNVTANGNSISVTFAIDAYTVSFRDGLSGTGWAVSGSGVGQSNSVDWDNDFYFFANVTTGYENLTVRYTINGAVTEYNAVPGLEPNEYYIPNVQGTIQIVVSSSIIKLNVEWKNGYSGAGWSTENVDEQVNYGGSYLISILLDGHYRQTTPKILINNVEVLSGISYNSTTGVATYTISNIILDREIEIVVVPNVYNVTLDSTPSTSPVNWVFDDTGYTKNITYSPTAEDDYEFTITVNNVAYDPETLIVRFNGVIAYSDTVLGGLIDGIDVGVAVSGTNNEIFTFTIPQMIKHLNITIELGLNVYTVTKSTEERVTINFENGDGITRAHGQPFTFTVTVDESATQNTPEFRINGTGSWIAMARVGATNTYTYTISSMTESIVISARAAVNTYNVTWNGNNYSGTGWSTANVNDTVTWNGEYTFTIDVDSSTHNSATLVVTVNHAEIFADQFGVYTISAIKGNQTIRVVSLDWNVYNVSVSGGSLSPAGWVVSDGDIVNAATNPIEHGSNFVFNAALKTGYNTLVVKYTMVGFDSGNPQTIAGVLGVYTIPNVIGDVVITVTSIINEYSVSFVGGVTEAAGWIVTDVLDTSPVKHGFGFAFEAETKEGYNTLVVTYTMAGTPGTHIVDAVGGVYTIENITGAVVIALSSSINTYTVTIPEGGAGQGFTAATADGDVDWGSSFTFTIALDSKHDLNIPTVTVTRTGQAADVLDEEINNAYYSLSVARNANGRITSITVVIKQVKEDADVDIQPIVNRYTISLTGNAYGSIAIHASDLDTDYEHGSDIRIIVTPNAGYNFLYLSSNPSGVYGVTYQVTVTVSGITNHMTIEAIFAENPVTTIYFDPNGGRITSGAGVIQQVSGNGGLTANVSGIEEPKRVGYVFQGWNENAAGTGAFVDTFVFSYNETTGVTYYAIWALREYEIIVDLAEMVDAGETPVQAGKDPGYFSLDTNYYIGFDDGLYMVEWLVWFDSGFTPLGSIMPYLNIKDIFANNDKGLELLARYEIPTGGYYQLRFQPRVELAPYSITATIINGAEATITVTTNKGTQALTNNMPVQVSGDDVTISIKVSKVYKVICGELAFDSTLLSGNGIMEYTFTFPAALVSNFVFTVEFEEIDYKLVLAAEVSPADAPPLVVLNHHWASSDELSMLLGADRTTIMQINAPQGHSFIRYSVIDKDGVYWTLSDKTVAQLVVGVTLVTNGFVTKTFWLEDFLRSIGSGEEGIVVVAHYVVRQTVKAELAAGSNSLWGSIEVFYLDPDFNAASEYNKLLQEMIEAHPLLDNDLLTRDGGLEPWEEDILDSFEPVIQAELERIKWIQITNPKNGTAFDYNQEIKVVVKPTNDNYLLNSISGLDGVAVTYYKDEQGNDIEGMFKFNLTADVSITVAFDAIIFSVTRVSRDVDGSPLPNAENKSYQDLVKGEQIEGINIGTVNEYEFVGWFVEVGVVKYYADSTGIYFFDGLGVKKYVDGMDGVFALDVDTGIINSLTLTGNFVQFFASGGNVITLVAEFGRKTSIEISIIDDSVDLNGYEIWIGASKIGESTEKKLLWDSLPSGTEITIVPQNNKYYTYEGYELDGTPGTGAIVVPLQGPAFLNINFKKIMYTMDVKVTDSNARGQVIYDETVEFGIGSVLVFKFEPSAGYQLRSMIVNTKQAMEMTGDMMFIGNTLTIFVTEAWLDSWEEWINANDKVRFEITVETTMTTAYFVSMGALAAGVPLITLGIVLVLLSNRKKKAAYAQALAKSKSSKAGLESQQFIKDLQSGKWD